MTQFNWQPDGNEVFGRANGSASFGSAVGVNNEISKLFEDLVVDEYYGLSVNFFGELDKRSPPSDAVLTVTINGVPLIDVSGGGHLPQTLKFKATSSCTVISISGRSIEGAVFIGPVAFGPVSAPSQCVLSNPGAFLTSVPACHLDVHLVLLQP